jgi:predicted RecA/RadA family phage recombinase
LEKKMKNYVQEGKVLEVTAPYALSSGDGCKVGDIFGIAAADYLISAAAQIEVEGVFDIAKDSSVFAQGADVYWDDSGKTATSTAGSNILIGVAVVAALTGGATVRVKLTQKPFALAMSGLGVTATAAEINVLHSVTAGTARASSGAVLDANKSIDLLQATTSCSLGGTGVPGAQSVQTEITKRVTGLADATATDILTVTVPNAEHNALIEVDVLGILGAGGSIGEGEASRASKYQIALARTAGVAVVPGISSLIGGAAGNVSGGQAITSVTLTLSTITGAVSAQQTFTVKCAITRAGSGATNHIAVVSARVLNANASGVTIA